MAYAALRRLRLSRNTGDEDDVNVDLDFIANVDDASGSVPVVNPATSGSGVGGAESGPQTDVADGGPKRKKNPGKGEKVLYTDFLKEVHEQVNIADNLFDVERQSLQHTAFLRYLRRDVVPSFSADLEKANAERESAVESLKQAKSDLDEAIKEKNKFQIHYTNYKSKYKASDSALTKLKEPSKAHAKWKEEKALVITNAEKVGNESFVNVVAQLKLLNPGLVTGGVSAEHEVYQGRICKVDAERKMIYKYFLSYAPSISSPSSRCSSYFIESNGSRSSLRL
ncbi:AH/BAR domain superfamily [Sesbania bispinosa]|nr:AH/BAR domain superfamily [Sesbania bispinosa]